MSALARKPNAPLVASGLQALSMDSRHRISRVLHDDVGPSLCSAGLMLDLVRSSSPDLPQESRDLLDSIQHALEASIESVRLLSYHNDPALADRCGWRGGIDYLTKDRRVQVTYPTPAPAFSAAEACFLVNLVHDVSLAWTTPHQITVTAAGLSLQSPTGPGLDAPRQAALAHLAAAAGFEFHYQDSESGILISVQRGRKA